MKTLDDEGLFIEIMQYIPTNIDLDRIQVHERLWDVLAEGHPKLEDCPDPECMVCGYRECPLNEPMHFHHDGCPAFCET